MRVKRGGDCSSRREGEPVQIVGLVGPVRVIWKSCGELGNGFVVVNRGVFGL